MRTLFIGIVTVATATVAASPVAAQILPGSRLTVAGTADATDIGSPGVVLDFGSIVAVDRTANTGSFASLNRPQGTALAGVMRDVTVGAGVENIPRFLTVGTFRFNVERLDSGPFSQAQCYIDPDVNQTCTPIQTPGTTLSPFYLVNEPSGDPDAPITAVASFNVIGNVVGPRGATSAFVGTFTSVFPGLSYQEVLGGLEAAGPVGLSGLPFSATFEVGAPQAVTLAAVPEPSTLALLGTGLVTIVGVARRRRRR